MNRLKKVSPWLSMLLVAASFMLLTAGECGAPRTATVTNCADAPANNCDAYKQADGTVCELDTASNKCRAKPTTTSFVQSDCQKITDKDVCQKDDSCLYKDNKCENADANEAGKCAAIKVDTICNAHESTKDKKKYVWDATASKCGDRPAKTVTEYTLSKVSKAVEPGGYNIAGDNTLAGITAAKDGENVYVISDTNNTLKALTITPNTWSDALGNFTAVRAAENVGGAVHDFSGAVVSKWEPLSDGILVWVTGQGAAQIVGAGAANSFGWARNAGHIKNADADGLGEITKGANTFLYMSVGAAGANVVFVQKNSAIAVNYPNHNWDNTLVEDENTGGVADPIAKRYSQFLPIGSGANAGALMLNRDGSNADLIFDPNLGVTNRWIINSQNGGAPVAADKSGMLNVLAENPAWRHVGGVVNVAKKFARMDKYLVAIFTNTGANTGGVALYDLVVQPDPLLAASWKWVDNSADATDIFVDRVGAMRDKRAIITAKAGFMILENDALVEPVVGQGFISNNANTDKAAVTTDWATAKRGFTGPQLPAAGGANQSYVGVAQDKNGLWYIAIKGHGAADGGIFTLDMKEVTLK